MDKIIDLFKFIVTNWKLIVPILGLIGIIGGYSIYSPVKPVELDITQAQPPNEITAPKPPEKPREVIIREIVREVPADISADISKLEAACQKLLKKHEKDFHFVN